ncbi:MAG: response regulator [Streptosporangiales bacterium]|nr:response regulator [Streptosporangiales bacterium]
MVRLIVAEGLDLVRGGIVALLDREDDFDVVADLSKGEQILPIARELDPDVVLIDFDIPGMDGDAAAAMLRRELPGCRILLLAEHRRPGLLCRAVGAGADGFLIKDTLPGRLVEAVRRLAAGERVIDSELAAAAVVTGGRPLTERELEVLRLTAEGLSPQETAERLFLAAGTVRNYLAGINAKLGAHTRIEAIRRATESGWL